MDHLWSPWRLSYVTGPKPKNGCIFCDAPHDTDQQTLIVFQGSACYVILNRYPYNNGHVMVVPFRHVDRLAGLGPDELHELARLTQRSEMALHEAYGVPGINVGINLGQ